MLLVWQYNICQDEICLQNSSSGNKQGDTDAKRSSLAAVYQPDQEPADVRVQVLDLEGMPTATFPTLSLK